MKKQLKTIIVAIIILSTCTAEATLTTIGQATYHNNSYNLIYDSNSPFGSTVWLDYSNRSTECWQDWNYQSTWADSLNTGGTLTYNLKPGYNVKWDGNWRLPLTVDGIRVEGYDGTTTGGYNVTTSEMGHLFYTELGDKGYFDINGQPLLNYGLLNKGDFANLESTYYWSGTKNDAYFLSYSWWYFDTNKGFQWTQDIQGTWWVDGIAVRFAQVSECIPAPEPSTIMLICAGLVCLAIVKRKKYL